MDIYVVSMTLYCMYTSHIFSSYGLVSVNILSDICATNIQCMLIKSEVIIIRSSFGMTTYNVIWHCLYVVTRNKVELGLFFIDKCYVGQTVKASKLCLWLMIVWFSLKITYKRRYYWIYISVIELSNVWNYTVVNVEIIFYHNNWLLFEYVSRFQK